MRLDSPILALAALAAVAAPSELDASTSDRKRRCARCRMPCNRCPCRHCHSCSTSGGDPETQCTCGARGPSYAAGGEPASGKGRGP